MPWESVPSDTGLCSVSAQGIRLHLTGTFFFKCYSTATVNRELAAFRAGVTAAGKFLGTVWSLLTKGSLCP